MSNVSIPKGQQTAYERWELSSFADTSQEGQARARKDAAIAEKGALLFDEMRKKGYAKGMQEGFALGMADAKERVQQDVQLLKVLMANFNEALEKSDEYIAEDVLSLALDVAKAMLKVKLNVDSSAVLPVVMDAINYLPHIHKPARILLHHDDVHMLREYMSDEISSAEWQLHEAPNIERGGCIVETATNQVDATNVVRWKRIAEALAQNNDWLLS